MGQFNYEPWPALPYDAFKSTAHLLHMGVQVLGKLKLLTPFEPHWSNVALWPTSRGLTTGLIPYQSGAFSFDIDFIDHQFIGSTTWGMKEKFDLTSMSVAALTEKIFSILKRFQIDVQINMKPQELENPIPFNQDTENCHYDSQLANAWWRILISSFLVMQRYHARYDGETPSIGLMWGAFDLRDARYNGVRVQPTGINAGYLRRNAMNEGQIEVGWWHGNEMYPQPAYYSFTYPEPEKIKQTKIKPDSAHWDDKMQEFILNYADVRASSHPEKVLMQFLESTYEIGAKLANWNTSLNTLGEPI